MGKGRVPHVGPVLVGYQVRHLIHEEGEVPQGREPARRRRPRSPSSGSRLGDDGAEVRVAAPLAVAVYRALHVDAPRLHRHERIGDGRLRVVVAMDAKLAPATEAARPPRCRLSRRACCRRSCRRGPPRRPRRRLRRLHDLEGVGAVSLVAVKEVLGVEKNGLAALLQIA